MAVLQVMVRIMTDYYMIISRILTDLSTYTFTRLHVILQEAIYTKITIIRLTYKVIELVVYCYNYMCNTDIFIYVVLCIY